MPTKEPRLNVVLDRETRDALAALAAHREISLSAAAADLIADALDDQEDRYWSAEAEERRKDKISPLSHEQIWRKALTKAKK